MTPLIIELDPGKQRNYHFLGWQQNGNCFYVLDDSNNPKIVELLTLYPYNRRTGEDFEFSRCEPVVIYPMRLKEISEEFEAQWKKASGRDYIPSFLGTNDAHDAQPKVCFAIQFSEKVTYYLSSVKIRSFMTVAEVDEFQKLTSVNGSKAEVVEKWHTPDFRTVSWHNRRGKLTEHSLTNEFRALFQMLSEPLRKSAQYGEIESKIGKRIRELDLADGQENMSSPPGPRRVRDLLNTQQGKLFVNLGILKIESVGREKFLKLCPPPSKNSSR